MSSEPIVHKEPVVQSNPFARHLSEHVNAGTVAVESERAIAEAQGKLVIAKRFPRDQARAYAAIIDACKRAGLAEEACYSFPRGGQTVSGPSIRLAEMLAANWGNIDYGIRELSRKEGVSEMEAYCWDLETNTMSSQKFTVRHIRDTKGGGIALKDERDIYELTANMGGRRLRARILAIIPADLIQAAVDECGKTLAGGNDLPIADRVRNMVTAFKVLGIQPALIEKRLGHALDTCTGEELGDLRKIHNSIRDGVSKAADWFGDRAKEADEMLEGDPIVRPPPPEREAKGAAAVKETVARKPRATPAAEPVAAPVVPPASVTVSEPAPEPKVETFAQAATNTPLASSPGAAQSAEPLHSLSPGAGAANAAPKERAFLTDGEIIDVVCKVKDVMPFNAKIGDTVTPSVQANVGGGYFGAVFAIGAATADGDKLTAKEPWVVGREVKLKLRGKHSAKLNKVQVVVDAAEAVAEEF